MVKIIKFFKLLLKHHGTISPFAIVRNTDYDKTTAIRVLVKVERSKIGKCSSIGSLSAAYDTEIRKYCSI